MDVAIPIEACLRDPQRLSGAAWYVLPTLGPRRDQTRALVFEGGGRVPLPNRLHSSGAVHRPDAPVPRAKKVGLREDQRQSILTDKPTVAFIEALRVGIEVAQGLQRFEVEDPG